MTAVPVLFRLLLITRVAALACGFVLPDFCFHYSFLDLGLHTEGLHSIWKTNACGPLPDVSHKE